MNSTSVSFGQSSWRRLKRNKGAMAGLVMIFLAMLLAVFSYLLAPDPSPFADREILEIGGEKPGFTQNFLLVKKAKPQDVNFFSRLISGKPDEYDHIPVSSYQQTPDSIVAEKYIDEGVTERISYSKDSLATQPVVQKKFYLGTDKYGRDILSRLIIGTRVSLSVGLITLLISLTVGILLGAMAGYFRGRTDNIVMWLINVIWSIPTLLLVFAITLLLGKGFWQVFIAVGLTMWVNVARLVRGQVMVTKELQYVEAGKVLGFSDF
ncbi:MAG: ABC transporter permease, partial [Flavisolibacter sp.]